jgi:hypothetical protein
MAFIRATDVTDSDGKDINLLPVSIVRAFEEWLKNCTENRLEAVTSDTIQKVIDCPSKFDGVAYAVVDNTLARELRSCLELMYQTNRSEYGRLVGVCERVEDVRLGGRGA